MMPKRHQRLSALLIAASLAATGQAAPQGVTGDPLEPEWTVERYNWSGELAQEAELRLLNRFGDIRTRPSEGPRVDLSAVIQRRADVADEPEISVNPHAGGLSVEVRFPTAVPQDTARRAGLRPDRRVDLVVFVPRTARLSARTERGLLEAKGLARAAELRSHSGDIVVRSDASIDARTEHGAIRAVLQSGGWNLAPRLRTLTGDIRLELPRRIDVVAKISTRAEITTDYSIEIERDGLLRTAVATIGTGEHEVSIETEKGRVALLESLE